MIEHDRPQRLSRPSAPGALLKRLVGLHTRVKIKEVAERDPVYLALVRQCPCIKCGLEPAGECAHIRLSSAAFNKRGGLAKKPSDRWTVPLCAGCHREDRDALHKIGEHLFWHRLGINPLYVADRMYRQRGDLVAMRAVILQAMVER